MLVELGCVEVVVVCCGEVVVDLTVVVGEAVVFVRVLVEVVEVGAEHLDCVSSWIVLTP